MPNVDKVVTRIPIAQGAVVDLHKHLLAASNLELWTIPLYLTALASIQTDELQIWLPARGAMSSAATTTVTRLIVSVALQEMYHLQLAGNLARLYGVAPKLDWPAYDGRIPYVENLPAGVTVKLGTANDVDTLRLMVAVETPSSIDEPVDPSNPDIPAFGFIQYDAMGEPCYPSIGALYSVAEQVGGRFRDQLAAGAPQIANGLFSAWWGKTGLLDRVTAAPAIDVIVDQGEGALGRQSAPLDDPNAIPDQRGYFDPFFAENHFSHVERFQLALDNAGRGVTVWPTTSPPERPGPAQARLSVVFANLLEGLRAGWKGERPDLGPMFLFRCALAQVYIAGEIPAFVRPGPASPSYSDTVAALAPEQGAAWGANVQYFFTYTDTASMKAGGIESPDLANQMSVKASQSAIAAVVTNAQMPPGELNVWPDAQVESFKNWGGN